MENFMTTYNVSRETYDRLQLCLRELFEWQKKFNLVGKNSLPDAWTRHFEDSAQLFSLLPENAKTLADLGSGAGFPGIPLKIAFPHIRIVLLDSLNKRLRFLNQVIEELDLEDITTLHGRAEDHAKKAEYREKFDLCASRAVANLSTLSEYCLPFVKKDGSFVSYKSGDSDEEIKQAEKAIKILGGEVVKVDKFMLPGSDMGRALVEIRKIKNTPTRYPRKAGVPGKEPL